MLPYFIIILIVFYQEFITPTLSSKILKIKKGVVKNVSFYFPQTSKEKRTWSLGIQR